MIILCSLNHNQVDFILEINSKSLKTKEGVLIFREYATGYAQHTTGEEWRNSSRKNEEAEPRQKGCPVVNMSGGGSKV